MNQIRVSRTMRAWTALLAGALLIAGCSRLLPGEKSPTGRPLVAGETVGITRIPPTVTATSAVPEASATPGGAGTPGEVINAQSAPALGILGQAGLGGVSAFTWLPDGHGLALATGSQVVIYDLQSGKAEAQADTGEAAQIQVAQGAQAMLAWVGAENKLFVWQPESGAAPKEMVTEAEAVTGIAIAPQGTVLAYATAPGEVKLVDPASGQVTQVWQTPAWLSDLAYSPDATLLGGVDEANFTVYMLDSGTGQVQRTLEWLDHASPALYGAHFSPNWQKLAWVARGSVEVMDVGSGKEIALLNHEDFVSAAAWSPDGKLLATAAAGTLGGIFTPAVYLWDATSGNRVGVFALNVPVQSMAFSPDGRKLAILTTDGQVQTWGVK